MFPQELEEFSINTWPGIQTYLYRGLVVRWAAGYTKRANSATPLYVNQTESLPDYLPQIEWVEQFYRERDQRPIFRLVSFNKPEPLDQALAKRGYQEADQTVVMVRPLSEKTEHINRNLSQSIRPIRYDQAHPEENGLSNWLEIYHRLDEKRPEGMETHLAILKNIPGKLFPFGLERDNTIVAAGLGALVGPTLGIYDIITAKNERRKGYGIQLMHELLQRGETAGATHAALAVIAANHSARALYSKLGFEVSHRYWYRIGTK